MKTYYIFLIKKDITRVYENNEKQLFKILDNLYHFRKTNLRYGITLYKQLCQIIDDKNIDNFLNNKATLTKNSNYYFKEQNEVSMVMLKTSCVIIKTNSEFPQLFKWLLFYNKNFFICDFENKQYYWLKNIINKINIYEYI
ncbi:MAG: sporulation inhibitor of replication protein SirA [Bacilli bacterium]|nr:sporulation inhibitor of replication protein SirA [Bacilli bacterium]